MSKDGGKTSIPGNRTTFGASTVKNVTTDTKVGKGGGKKGK